MSAPIDWLPWHRLDVAAAEAALASAEADLARAQAWPIAEAHPHVEHYLDLRDLRVQCLALARSTLARVEGRGP